MKTAYKVFSGLLTTVLVVVLLISMYVLVSSKATGGQPSIFGNQLMLVLSGSMEPTLSSGSIVGVKPIEDNKKADLEKGDIVTFYSPIKKNQIVTHRIIGKQGTGNFTEYLTRGDNNEVKDPMPVPASKIIGVHSGIHVPYVGYVLEFLQSKNGIALSMIIPGLILIVYNTVSLFRILTSVETKQQIKSNSTSA
ncbi:signal peptidase I [Pontibacillus yanchengensis]|uniref:Signal peptidase I n=1 Tax=Pontibacillus yanchengensis TaxID=462910 RepID=A0A6I4ZZS4_9BACI|nr:signal peptidase I [Pontibacillus yanchengensis]MYL34526.1 signal peptidase I [Pontibacillus yanchengensis]